jgi:hypothetical protein
VLLEIGDKIGLITKDNEKVYSYILNDRITYDGGLQGTTQWNYSNNDNESATNPATLGEVLKQTYAKVDKVNKEINIVASNTSENSKDISAIKLDTASISASVSSVQEQADAINRKVDAQITADGVTLIVQEELNNGVNNVKTGKGYTFNDEGLTVTNIDEENNEISTTVSNNGMKVKVNAAEVLTADAEGVKAKDLHATTFLIVGKNSRFEDYGYGRTACFWIGG